MFNPTVRLSKRPAGLRALALTALCLPAIFSTAGAEGAAAPALEVEHYTLDNGMQVMLSHDDRLPVVAVEVRYFVGSAHEVKGRTGFAHLFEHLMFQGSQNFDNEYFAPFEPIGAQINGTTSTDRTNYYVRLPSNYLELALWMESDRMANLLPALTMEKLNNQRDVVKNERRQSYENRPYGMVWKLLKETLFPEGHPYHHTTIGSHADLTAATLDDVKAFFRKYYVPTNAVITIVGDFDRAHAKALVKKYFGGLAKGERAPTPKAELPTLEGPIHLRTTDQVKLPRVYLAWVTPALYAQGDAEMDVLASVLSDGKTSRLYKPLVYEQKVANDVAAFQVSSQLGSFFVIQATAAPGKTADEVGDALLKAVDAALATAPSQDEFDRALNGWRKSFYGRVEGVLSRAQLLSTYLHLTGSPDYLGKDLARYTELTPANLHAAAQKWLTANRRLRLDVVVGEKSETATPVVAEGGQ
ncbi:MAG: M16 family metallopeptidase [Bradymonadia bacterium]